MSKIFTKQENHQWSHTLPGKMTSACVVLRSGTKALMVKAIYKDHWTFPSGIVDVNESPKSAAIRETFEEVGLTVKADDCHFLTVVFTAASDGDRDRLNFAFVTDKFNETANLSVPNNEIEKAEWVNFNEVASRSGYKESYVNFQRILLSPGTLASYVECYPELQP
ncbi:MAG TPA: NUDIX hydrolase [Patescibacteria group bacterium]|jgi:8-oxo-dGTP diphosphatase|nr:NUDIX hydrolase [Patescibacteria group bacterium]